MRSSNQKERREIMKNILCFGDSNTYGESPEGNGRYPRDVRWTGLLQKALGEKYYVIEAGLNGRTTVWDDPVEAEKNGLKQLPSFIASNTPLDLLIIMLGSNDLKVRFHVTPTDIALSLERLVQTAKTIPNYTSDQPFKILLVSPVPIHEKTFLGEVFGDRSEDSRRLGTLVEAVARRNSVEFLDMAGYAQASVLDGLHFDKENHKLVAKAMEEKILSILKES